MSNTDLKEWALKYAALGFAVFPLQPKTKIPATPDGFKSATTDIEKIESWWNAAPYNIGIATGAASGSLLVIDLDVDKGKGKDGKQAAMQWLKKYGKDFPKTAIAKTGRGGLHMLFYGNGRNKTNLLPGVDVRGEGGYIVAPPSIHPNGNSYQWLSALKIAAADETVYAFINQSESKARNIVPKGDAIPEGQRTDALIRLVGSLKAKGLSNEAIEAAVTAENNSCCNPPLTDQELTHQVFPAIYRGWETERPYKDFSKRKNWNSQPPERREDVELIDGFEAFEAFEHIDNSELKIFPTACLPPVLEDYSNQIEESLQVINQMIGPALLGVVSICIRGEYNISPKADWIESMNLYMLVINNPSEKKSPVLKEILRPVYMYVDQENKERAPRIITERLRKNILSKQIENALRAISTRGTKATKETEKEYDTRNSKASKVSKGASELVTEDKILDMQTELADLEENGEKPLTVLADDFTTEALVKLLHENDERIAVASAEGGIFGMMAGRYSTQPNIDIFLKGFSGEPYVSHRVSGRTETLKKPLIALLLMVQPIVVAEAFDNREFRERGLLARFLYSKAGTRIGTRTYRTKAIDPKTRQAWDDLVTDLLKMSEWEHPGTIYLSDEADHLGEEFFNEIETTLYDTYEDMADWIGKFFGQTMRIAGVLHVVENRMNSASVKVSAETMKNAIEIGRYFLDHAIYVFLQSGLYDSQEVKAAKYILKRMESAGVERLSKRDLYQLCRRKTGFEAADSELFVKGLEELRKRGYIKIEKVSTGGRPTETVVLNPEYLEYRKEKRK